MKDFFSVGEVAAVLGTNPWTLRRAMSRLPPMPRAGDKRRIPLARLAEVADELERRQRRPGKLI